MKFYHSRLFAFWSFFHFSFLFFVPFLSINSAFSLEPLNELQKIQLCQKLVDDWNQIHQTSSLCENDQGDLQSYNPLFELMASFKIMAHKQDAEKIVEEQEKKLKENERVGDYTFVEDKNSIKLYNAHGPMAIYHYTLEENLNGGRVLFSQGINVNEPFKGLGISTLLYSKVLMKHPQVKEVVVNLVKDNYLVFWNSLGQYQNLEKSLEEMPFYKVFKKHGFTFKKKRLNFLCLPESGLQIELERW